MHVLGSPHAFLHCIFFSCIHSHSLVFGLVSLLGLLSLVGSCYLTSVLIHGLVSDLLSPPLHCVHSSSGVSVTVEDI